MIGKFIDYLKRRRYKAGRRLSRFVARDVRRDIEIVSADRIDEGFLTVRMKTNNILYLHHDLTKKEGFGDELELAIADLWKWRGKSWGGLADGTSITGVSPEDTRTQHKHNKTLDTKT